MDFKFCPRCGTLTIKKQFGDDILSYCTNCNKGLHDFFYTCVIVACVNKNDEVAVIKQSYGEDKYVLVAGFVNMHESLEECVKREVKEELGLDTLNLKYMNSYPMDNKDNLMVAYKACVDGLISLSSEVREVKFVKKEEALKLLSEAKIARKVVESL